MISDILITIGVGILVIILLLFFAIALFSFEEDFEAPKFIKIIGCIEMIIFAIGVVLSFAYMIGNFILGSV